MMKCWLLIVLASSTCTPLHVAGDASVEVQPLSEEASVQEHGLQLAGDSNAEVANSILKTIQDALWKQLHTEKNDWVNGLGAFVVGFALVSKAEQVFSWVVVGSIFVMVYLLAKDELSSGDEDMSALRRFEALEIGLLVAWAAKKSINTVYLLVGSAIGLACSKSLEAAIIMQGYTLNPYGIGLMYTAVVLLFVAAFNSKFHVQVFAVVSSFIGGGLVASSLQFGLTCLLSDLDVKGVTPKKGAWIDFLYLLVNTGKVENDVGIFVGSAEYNPTVLGTPLCGDQVIGRLIWLVLFVTRTRAQLKRIEPSDKVGALEPLLPE